MISFWPDTGDGSAQRATEAEPWAAETIGSSVALVAERIHDDGGFCRETEDVFVGLSRAQGQEFHRVINLGTYTIFDLVGFRFPWVGVQFQVMGHSTSTVSTRLFVPVVKGYLHSPISCRGHHSSK